MTKESGFESEQEKRFCFSPYISDGLEGPQNTLPMDTGAIMIGGETFVA
jgi:hypothetical protein